MYQIYLLKSSPMFERVNILKHVSCHLLKNYIKVFGPNIWLALRSRGVDGGRWPLHKNKNKNHPTPLYSPVDHSNPPPPLKKIVEEKDVRKEL